MSECNNMLARWGDIGLACPGRGVLEYLCLVPTSKPAVQGKHTETRCSVLPAPPAPLNRLTGLPVKPQPENTGLQPSGSLTGGTHLANMFRHFAFAHRRVPRGTNPVKITVTDQVGL